MIPNEFGCTDPDYEPGDEICPDCGGQMYWCRCCEVWDRSCCVEWGTCECS